MSRSLWSFVPMSLCAALVAATCACKGGGAAVGGVPGADGEGDASADAGAWLDGEWSGNYRNKEADAGASLRETTANASFKVDEDSVDSGTFEITLPMLDEVHVAGSFRDFARKSLMLKISESNLSALGLSGSSTSLDYDMVGDALELSNDRVVLRLLRGEGDDNGGGTGGNDDNDDNSGPPSLLGAWTCGDKVGHTWRLNMRSEDAFAIDIYDIGSTSAGIRMDGGVSMLDGTTLNKGDLEVTWSNISDYVGLRLTASLVSDDEIRLARLAADSDDEVEVMTCARDR